MIIIFRDVVKSEEFLFLPNEELVKFISGNVLNASEEKVSKFSKLRFIIVPMCIVFYYFGCKINYLHTYILLHLYLILAVPAMLCYCYILLLLIIINYLLLNYWK